MQVVVRQAMTSYICCDDIGSQNALRVVQCLHAHAERSLLCRQSADQPRSVYQAYRAAGPVQLSAALHTKAAIFFEQRTARQ